MDLSVKSLVMGRHESWNTGSIWQDSRWATCSVIDSSMTGVFLVGKFSTAYLQLSGASQRRLLGN